MTGVSDTKRMYTAGLWLTVQAGFAVNSAAAESLSVRKKMKRSPSLYPPVGLHRMSPVCVAGNW